MRVHTVRVISKTDSIEYILSRLVLSGRLSKCIAVLKQHDLIYMLQRAVKGQTSTDFLADHPVPDDWELNDNLPAGEVFVISILPPYEMYFDSAAWQDGIGARVILVSLRNTSSRTYSRRLSHAPTTLLNLRHLPWASKWSQDWALKTQVCTMIYNWSSIIGHRSSSRGILGQEKGLGLISQAGRSNLTSARYG